MRLTIEQRDYLKSLYFKVGSKIFLQSEVMDIVPKSTFRKLCDSKVIIKSGVQCLKVQYPGRDTYDLKYVNGWRINLTDELVRKYAT